MDCLTARTTLDVLRPGDAGGPEAVQAAAHLTACPECRAVVRSRAKFDRKLGEVCRNVPIPLGLKDRLVATVHAEARVASTVAGRTRTRRWWMYAAAACVAVVAIGCSAVYFLAQPSRMPLQTVAELVTDLELSTPMPPQPPFAFASPSLFGSPLAASPPRVFRIAAIGQTNPLRLGIDNQWFGVWAFTARNSKRQMSALLVVAPLNTVQLPSSGLGTQGRWSMVYWAEGDLLYVLLLEGPERDLKRLMDPAETM